MIPSKEKLKYQKAVICAKNSQMKQSYFEPKKRRRKKMHCVPHNMRHFAIENLDLQYNGSNWMNDDDDDDEHETNEMLAFSCWDI
jgi:hypothetical protein